MSMDAKAPRRSRGTVNPGADTDCPEKPQVLPDPDDYCVCGHRYHEHRMLCDCHGRETDCGHAAGEYDTSCFHLEGKKYCPCVRFRKSQRRRDAGAGAAAGKVGLGENRLSSGSEEPGGESGPAEDA